MSPRLFLHVMSLEVRRSLTYRADFWIQSLLTFLAEIALAWFLWRGVFDASGATTIGGYTFAGAVRYTLLVALASKVVRGTGIEGGIAQEIYDGSLSRYRMYPASYFAFKYAQHLGTLLPAFVQLMLFGGAWLLVAGPGAFDGVTLATVLRSVAALALANLLYFTLTWPIQGVAFWAENVWSLMVALRFVGGLLGGMLLPLSVFPEYWRPLLDLLPFRYAFAFPVETFSGNVSGLDWLLGCAIALAWVLALRALGAWVWRRGSLVYSGAGM
jgi:ABC-2 type transport system permease protein